MTGPSTYWIIQLTTTKPTYYSLMSKSNRVDNLINNSRFPEWCENKMNNYCFSIPNSKCLQTCAKFFCQIWKYLQHHENILTWKLCGVKRFTAFIDFIKCKISTPYYNSANSVRLTGFRNHIFHYHSCIKPQICVNQPFRVRNFILIFENCFLNLMMYRKLCFKKLCKLSIFPLLSWIMILHFCNELR